MPEISIIIPAYNARRFLVETLESVLGQTFTEWELVVVDDGSTDDTRAIAADFAARDERVRVVWRENGGLPAARNFGYAASSPETPYVIFLDADDVWETDALALLHNHIQRNPDCAAVNGLGRFVDEHGEPFPSPDYQRWGLRRSVIVGRDIEALAPAAPTRFETLLLENCILTAGVILIRRSALDAVGLFDDAQLEGHHIAQEDWDLWLRLSAKWDILLLPTVVLSYRRHSTSLSTQKIAVTRETYTRHRMCHLSALAPNQRQTAMWVYQRTVTSQVMEEARRYRRASYQEARIAWQSLTGGQVRLSSSHWRKFLQLYLKYRQGRAKFHACDLPQPVSVLFGLGASGYDGVQAGVGGARRAKGDLPALQFLSERPLTDSSPRYRCSHTAEQWQLRGGEASIKCLEDAGPLTLLGDVLVFHRAAYDETAGRIVKAARAAGKVLLYSTDDLTIHSDIALKAAVNFDLARFHDSSIDEHAARVWQCDRNYAEAQRRLLEQCHAAIVSTEYLADRVRSLGKTTYVLRNALSARLINLSRQAREAAACRPPVHGRLMLGYLSGTATHDHDFGDIAPVVAEIMARHRNVYLTLVGPIHLPDCLRSFGVRVRRLPFVPWPDLPGVIASLDVNLAPLDLFQPFNHAKSELKWMEAGAVGVPTIASASCGYREAVTHGRDGLLAGTLDEWEEGLCALIDRPDLRQRLGEAALRAVSARYTPDARSRDLAAAIQDLYQRRDKTALAPAHSSPPVIMRPVSR